VFYDRLERASRVQATIVAMIQQLGRSVFQRPCKSMIWKGDMLWF